MTQVTIYKAEQLAAAGIDAAELMQLRADCMAMLRRLDAILFGDAGKTIPERRR